MKGPYAIFIKVVDGSEIRVDFEALKCRKSAAGFNNPYIPQTYLAVYIENNIPLRPKPQFLTRKNLLPVLGICRRHKDCGDVMGRIVDDRHGLPPYLFVRSRRTIAHPLVVGRIPPAAEFLVAFRNPKLKQTGLDPFIILSPQSESPLVGKSIMLPRSETQKTVA